MSSFDSLPTNHSVSIMTTQDSALWINQIVQILILYKIIKKKINRTNQGTQWALSLYKQVPPFCLRGGKFQFSVKVAFLCFANCLFT